MSFKMLFLDSKLLCVFEQPFTSQLCITLSNLKLNKLLNFSICIEHI